MHSFFLSAVNSAKLHQHYCESYFRTPSISLPSSLADQKRHHQWFDRPVLVGHPKWGQMDDSKPWQWAAPNGSHFQFHRDDPVLHRDDTGWGPLSRLYESTLHYTHRGRFLGREIFKKQKRNGCFSRFGRKTNEQAIDVTSTVDETPPWDHTTIGTGRMWLCDRWSCRVITHIHR